MEQLCISIEEASKISMIGINRLRKIMKDVNCPFALNVGGKKQVVKLDAFKKWLSEIDFV